jgi:uncharacterized protein YukE
MGTLVVDTEQLRSLASSLSSIHRSLENADGDTDRLAGMIPHERLAHTVQEFADGWDRRRGELTEQVGQLRDTTTTTADAFEGTDDQLADRISERPE